MQFLSGRLLRVCSRFVTSFLHILDAGKSTCSPLIFNKISKGMEITLKKIQYTEGLENVVGSREEGWNTNIFYAIFDESVFYRFYDETALRSFGNPRKREVHPEELHPKTVFSCIKRTSKVTLKSVLAISMLELKDNSKFVTGPPQWLFHRCQFMFLLILSYK